MKGTAKLFIVDEAAREWRPVGGVEVEGFDLKIETTEERETRHAVEGLREMIEELA